MLFKLINNILYLTTVHKNCVDPQINIFNLSFNELLYKKLTPSIYSVHPYTHKLTLLGCTVHLKCSVLYQYCVHIHHTFSHNNNNKCYSSFNLVALLNKHPNSHTTLALVHTYTPTIKLFRLQTVVNYIS